ncbi:MAG: hypothetical protein ACRETR_04415, partial [Steroidobacteraceae bacterium]
MTKSSGTILDGGSRPEGRGAGTEPRNEVTGGRDEARILIVDDNPAIHRDFDKILGAGTEPAEALAGVESLLFGDAPAAERER